MNHEFGEGSYLEIDTVGDKFKVLAGRDFKEGDEFTISYGE